MQNVSQNASKDDDGKANLKKGRVGPINKEQQKNLYDAKSEATQRTNGYKGYSAGAYSGPSQITGSSGFTWTKRRKPDASSVLSDGSRSKISSLDPTFAKGTYDLTKHKIEVSERKHNYDTSEPVEQSVPTMIQPSKSYELLHRNESSIQRSARRSRLGIGKETFFL